VLSLQSIHASPQNDDGLVSVEWTRIVDDMRGFSQALLLGDRTIIATGISSLDNTTLTIITIDLYSGEVEGVRSILLGGANSVILCTAIVDNKLVVGSASDYILYKNISLVEFNGEDAIAIGHLLLEPSVTPYSASCNGDTLFIAGSIIADPKTRSPYIVKARVAQGTMDMSSEAVYSEYINMTIIDITVVKEDIIASMRPIIGSPGKLGTGSTILALSRSTLELSGKYDMGDTTTVVGVKADGRGNIIAYGYDVNARGKIVILDRVDLQPISTITLEAPSIITAVSGYNDLIVGAGSVILKDKTVPILLVYDGSVNAQPRTYTIDEWEDLIVTSVIPVSPVEYILAGFMNGKAFMGKLRVSQPFTPGITSETAPTQRESVGLMDPVTLMLMISTVTLMIIVIGLAIMLYRKRSMTGRR